MTTTLDAKARAITELRAKADDITNLTALFNAEKDSVTQYCDTLRAAEVDGARRRAAEAKKAAAQKKADELKAAVAAKAAAAAASMNISSYGAFLKARGQLYQDTKLRFEVLSKAASYDAHDIRYAELETCFSFLTGWTAFTEAFTRTLADLEAAAKKLQAAHADSCDLAVVKDGHAALQKVYEEAAGRLAREQNRRQSYNEKVAALIANQGKLVEWCRQQRATLEGLKDSEHVQEFCASFKDNISTMEQNFLVVMEMSEDLVPNETVEKALVKATEVWVSLEVFVYEKLRTTLLDLHHRSGVENSCKLWSEFGGRFKSFLQDAERLLDMPTDEESRQLTKPVLEQCRQLINDHGLHAVIVDHLSDFALREECIKDHYSAIRRTIFSKLTLLTQTFHGQYSYPRKQEYTDRLAELSNWVDCKSKSEAWRELLGRVERMRELIDESENAGEATNDDRY